jgi:hypothetical protein
MDHFKEGFLTEAGKKSADFLFVLILCLLMGLLMFIIHHQEFLWVHVVLALIAL